MTNVFLNIPLLSLKLILDMHLRIFKRTNATIHKKKELTADRWVGPSQKGRSHLQCKLYKNKWNNLIWWKKRRISNKANITVEERVVRPSIAIHPKPHRSRHGNIGQAKIPWLTELNGRRKLERRYSTFLSWKGNR